jgi:flagellar hook-associated protein 1
MPSTFFGLSSALSGLMAHQRALDTTTHNITNINTEGYTRQRVDMRAAPSFPQPAVNTEVAPGQLGTGVQIQDFARLRDQFVDLQFRAQTATHGQLDARAKSLDRLNEVIDEPGDTGLTNLLGKFWSSWQALSLNAESPATREAVRSAGVQLAQGFADTRAQLVASQDEADRRITATVDQLNLWAGQINELNQAIGKVVGVGMSPNDLLDQRDLLVDRIAAAGEVAVTTPGPNGKISLAFGGQVLVDGTSDTVNPVAVTAGGAVTVGGVPATVTTGALRGLIDIRDTTVGGAGGYIAALDALAGTVIAEVNSRHAAGFGLDGTGGRAFFSGTDAATMAVDGAVVASTDVIAASGTAAGAPGNADNAVALSQLRFVALTIGGQTSTVDGAWSAWVSRLGVDADQASRLREVQEGVLQVATARRDAVSGVNMDEEVADMVRFQKSYNAAARMITTLDQMLETIVSRMGLVGR